jgi:hypothetical protein
VDETLLDLIESIIHSGQKVYVAYEKEDGTTSSITNGDVEFISKVSSNLVGIKKQSRKHYAAKSEARNLKNEYIGKVRNEDVLTPASNEDEEIEKKFTIN